MNYIDDRSLLDKLLYRIATAVCLIPAVKRGYNMWTALYYSRKPMEIDHVPEYPNLVRQPDPQRAPPGGCGPTHIDRADFYAIETSDFYTPDGYSYDYCRQSWVVEIARLDALIDEAWAMQHSYSERMGDGRSVKCPQQWDEYGEWLTKMSDYRFDLLLHREKGLAIIAKIDETLGRPAA